MKHSRFRVVVAALGFGLLAFGALAIDMWVARGMTQLDLPGDIAKLINYAEVFGHGLGVALIILVATTLDARHWRVGAFLAAHALGAGLLANLIKFLIQRLRPYHCPNLHNSVWTTFVGWGLGSPSTTSDHALLRSAATASFPSAHSATAAGLALGLSLLYPRGRWWFWLFALLAGIQRMVAHAHFTSDVLTGCALAMIVGLLVRRDVLNQST